MAWCCLKASSDVQVQIQRAIFCNTHVQDLMRSASDTTNVVEACNLDGRQERLDAMLTQLEQCEKALQVPARPVYL